MLTEEGNQRSEAARMSATPQEEIGVAVGKKEMKERRGSGVEKHRKIKRAALFAILRCYFSLSLLKVLPEELTPDVVNSKTPS